MSVLGKASVISPSLFVPLVPSFIVMGIALAICGVYLPFGEEHSRKSLINYLEDD